ncbi:MAG: hypothetical protein WC641_01725 [Patescibacteria group bacterium]
MKDTEKSQALNVLKSGFSKILGHLDAEELAVLSLARLRQTNPNPDSDDYAIGVFREAGYELGAAFIAEQALLTFQGFVAVDEKTDGEVEVMRLVQIVGSEEVTQVFMQLLEETDLLQRFLQCTAKLLGCEIDPADRPSVVFAQADLN